MRHKVHIAIANKNSNDETTEFHHLLQVFLNESEHCIRIIVPKTILLTVNGIRKTHIRNSTLILISINLSIIKNDVSHHFKESIKIHRKQKIGFLLILKFMGM